MLFLSWTAVAAAVLAGQATIAEPVRQPYKLKLAQMSTRQIFGLQRRQDDEGYAPAREICGSGTTCADACGKGFAQCASRDDAIHCYDKSAKQTCCPGKTGDSCDDGFFCSADEDGATWCCPDSMSLEECAEKYNLPGPLVTETPSATPSSTPVSRPTSASEPDSAIVSNSAVPGTTSKAALIEVTTSSTTDAKDRTTLSSGSAQPFIPIPTTTTVATGSVTSAANTLITPTNSPVKSPAPTTLTASTTDVVTAGGSNLNSARYLILLVAGAMGAVL